MSKYWMVIGLTMALCMACGEKAPTPAPPAPPTPATAPEAAQDQMTEPADTVKAGEAAQQTGAMVKASARVDPSKMPPGPYTIQVAAWETRDEADKLAEFFTGKGYEARVETADVKGGRWYRVRVGEFEDFSKAQDTALEIQEQYKSEIWLVKL